MVEDNYLSLCMLSSTQDVDFNASDIELFDDIEKLVWDEMLNNIKFIKNTILKLGLVIMPLFGQYKYKIINRLTFEYSILVPFIDSYTGYGIDVNNSFFIDRLNDFRTLMLDLCDMLGKETILYKSFAEKNTTEIVLMNKMRKVEKWLERRVEKISGKELIDYASLLMEDANAKVPNLDITELHGEDLRKALLDSDKWWSITNSKDRSLLSVIHSLYTGDERKLLKSLSVDNYKNHKKRAWNQ